MVESKERLMVSQLAAYLVGVKVEKMVVLLADMMDVDLAIWMVAEMVVLVGILSVELWDSVMVVTMVALLVFERVAWKVSHLVDRMVAVMGA